MKYVGGRASFTVLPGYISVINPQEGVIQACHPPCNEGHVSDSEEYSDDDVIIGMKLVMLIQDYQGYCGE